MFIFLLLLGFVILSLGRSSSFFGARVEGKYHKHFDKQLECAFVVGWRTSNKPICMCHIVDPSFSGNKVFMATEDDTLCR